MSTGLLFVIAPEADHKVINHLLLRLRDWEYESNDRFKLITSKSIDALTPAAGEGNEEEEKEEKEKEDTIAATSAPVDPDLVNEWSGASLEEVEAFCLELDKAPEDGAIKKALDTHLFVVLDTDGIGGETCILGERVIAWEDEPISYPEEFNKARLPWDETYLTWCNLDISNMGWDEFMEEDSQEVPEDRWWTYSMEPIGMADSAREQRDGEINRLKEEGKI